MKVSLWVAGTLIFTTALLADAPGRHPRYLHARADLWRASSLMEGPDEPSVQRDFKEAAREVREAIGEIERAAALDRKDMDDHPRVDANLRGKGKFRAIGEMLWGARRDIDQVEDNPRARAGRDRAHEHIDKALGIVRRAAHDARFDEEFRR